MKKASEARVLTAVGSRHDQRCSVGTFARAEAQSLKKFYASSDLLEPTADGIYPQCGSIARPDLILFHAPSLYDRRRPWNALLSAGNLRKNFQKAKFVVVVHEYSEAPRHWQLRVIALLRLACAVIVHSDADREALGRWHRWVVKAPLSPCLFVPEFFGGEAAERRAALLPELLGKARAALPKETDLKTGEKLVLHPGLLVPGKGVNFLGRLEPYLAGKARLVVMGGLGPKERDKIYARRT
ncbi:MAG: hypothetical protein HY074_11975, partial [Deltaproteobacteria bacterium]|nr:hypothetical protein [Deltaproteobacteria bacterium]